MTMALNGLEGDDLVQNLRNFVISLEPHIREAGTVDQVEETLLHLEENDQNFHKYEFVKQLKRKIDEQLGGQIEEEIEKQTTGSHEGNGEETLVNRITERILQSRPYTDLSRKLKKNVLGAVDELMRNFDAEFGEGRHRNNSFSRADHGKYFHGSDEEESSCSSYNQESLMFMNPEHLQQLAEKLRGRDPQIRREALLSLNQIPVSDVVNCDAWPVIRKILPEILSDPDEQLAVFIQKFITRAFTSTSNQTCEIYTILAEHLISQFHSRTTYIPKIKNGLDINKPDNMKLLKLFRLLNEFQQETTSYWIRYPERYLEVVLESTLNLYAMHHMGPVGTSAQLTPLHFVALLDIKAQWFIKWMHGAYSRMPLLERLQKYRPIVENAVRHCLEFSASRKVPFDVMSDISDTLSKTSIEGKRMFYTGAELEYAYFIHSVCLIGRILCFVNGRTFFPIKLRDSEEPVTVKKLVVALVLIVVDPSVNFHATRSSAADKYDPAKLVTEVLKGLCSSEQVCETCLFKDEITSTLLSPISHFLDVAYWSDEDSIDPDHQTPSESTLLHVADILCMIASSTKGRRHLIYGEKKDIFTRTKSSAAHIIAEFTKKALLKNLPKEAGQAPSQAVIGAYLYICHQLYNTCEGLLVLYPYELHASVKKAWQEASQESESVPTPTPIEEDDSFGDSSSPVAKESYDLIHWEDTLRDNLLNFASTAKGILLLQQTGALNECIVYMNARYEKKLQVSKCEKFGYGYMVTQVAATAPGMAALEKTGYLKALISELWAVLECGPSDAPLFTPKSWPVDPVERISHKHLIRLLNVLSAFPAVYEVLASRPLPTKDSYTFREMPDTIAGFMDRLVLLNSPAKIHSLFNVEQSHAFGLRVLSVMISCLDTYLLLQAQYKFQEYLLSDQSDNVRHADSNEIIVDCLSAERNNILVRSYQLGGPSERTLPPRIIQNKENPYPYTMFTQYPIPKEYIPNQGRSAMKQDNELIKFLDSKKPEKGKAWLEKCRIILVKLLQTKPEQVKGKVVQKLLEQAAAVMTAITEEAIFPLLQFSGNDGSVKKFNLSPLQLLGIKIAVRYGIQLKMIHTSSEALEKLGHLLKKCALFLQQQQKPVDSKLLYLQGSYPGFDWFASTIFIIFSGNNEKSWEFLHEFSTLGASGYLWMPRLHASVHLPTVLMSSGIPPLFSSTGHNIELILQIELPLLASAFRMSGYTPTQRFLQMHMDNFDDTCVFDICDEKVPIYMTQICLHWLKQCFWNYLDWFDICHYICVCLILGIDYQVYLCVAILKHLQKQIMEHMQTQDLIIFLKEEPIHGFHVSKNLKYMQELEKKYRKIILPDLLNITKP